ncbi:MAG TPA: YdcF family protein [Candidatus Eisenbacteria bacterium]|jgi:vancomycin permeability regulator SanA
MRRWRNPARLAGALLLLAPAGMLALASYGACARPGMADVAIVFGNTVRRDGTPSARLVARLGAALRVYREGRVRTLFVSGGIGREGYDESRVMRDWLLAHAVPDAAVVRDSLGLDTAHTAAHARAWMREHGARRALVVTQYFHVARATLACRAAGITVAGGSAPAFIEPRDVYSLARELVGLPVYALRAMASRPPAQAIH